MAKLETLSVVDPPKEMREAIRVLVSVYGCTIRVPVRYSGVPSIDTAEKLDQAWAPLGVYAHVDLKASYFGRRVQQARADAGMPAHAFIQDHITFEPEPLNG